MKGRYGIFFGMGSLGSCVGLVGEQWTGSGRKDKSVTLDVGVFCCGCLGRLVTVVVVKSLSVLGAFGRGVFGGVTWWGGGGVDTCVCRVGGYARRSVFQLRR